MAEKRNYRWRDGNFYARVSNEIANRVNAYQKMPCKATSKSAMRRESIPMRMPMSAILLTGQTLFRSAESNWTQKQTAFQRILTDLLMALILYG